MLEGFHQFYCEATSDPSFPCNEDCEKQIAAALAAERRKVVEEVLALVKERDLSPFHKEPSFEECPCEAVVVYECVCPGWNDAAITLRDKFKDEVCP